MSNSIVFSAYVRASIKATPTIHPHTKADFWPRTEGSYIESGVENTNEGVVQFLLSLEWEDITEDTFKNGAGFGTCKYFQAAIPDGVVAKEAAVTLSEFAAAGGSTVNVVQGRHQVELQSSEIKPQPTSVVSIAIGPYGEFDAVYFWAPGRVLPPTGVVKLG